MANVIEYYLPVKFRKQFSKWVPPEQRGKIIPFPTREVKSARHEDSALRTFDWKRWFASGQ